MIKKLGDMSRAMAVVVGVLVLAYLGWWIGNPAIKEMAWEGGVVKSFSFAPYQKNENPMMGKLPTEDEIRRDLEFISDYGYGVRTYSVLDGLDVIPKLAKEYDLKVTLGAWIDKNETRDQQELAQFVKIMKANRDTVTAGFIGNETILRGDKTAAEMVEIIKSIKKQVRQPISTAEVWQTWLAHPELVKSVDFIAVHVLPYWEGVPIDHAVNHVFRRYDELKAAYPDKKILLAEVGWPSAGPWMMGAEPSTVNQARFIREFLNEAHRRGVDYTIMEAFDQPWKYALEGPVGTAWGIFNSDRVLKFPMEGAIHENEHWERLFIFAALLALPFMLFFLGRRQDVRLGGQVFYCLLIMVFSSLLVLTVAEVVTQALLISIGIAWSLLVFAQVIMVAVTLFDGFEMTEMLWKQKFLRKFEPLREADLVDAPKVSVHVPCYNEPPEMVINTLNHLAALNYPNFEVLVIDNNTRDENIWQPVEAHCKQLGARFHFYHLPSWPGFKAGALNYALSHTPTDADIVAVIDSDYAVEPDWLAAMVPYFHDQKVGLVQSPQSYRDWRGNVFKTMCNWEYEGFFKIGMVQRNERNAIIQHGTMTMIRKSALQQGYGWAEWCITEDAELGLRLFQEGLEAVYCPEPFGRGLTPDSFAAYKSQRFRWAYGAMQIIKKHWKEFLPGQHKLTLGQKYHFIAGWLPWLADGAHLIFVFSSIFWSIGDLIIPKIFGFPPSMFMVPTIAAFAAKLVFSFWLYSRLVKCELSERIGAAIAGMSLSFTVGRAMLSGLVTKNKPFIRTPKLEGQPALRQVWLMARSEIILLISLVTLAIAVPTMASWANMQAVTWSVLLLVQALPYAAATIMAIANILPTRRNAEHIVITEVITTSLPS